MTHTSVFLVSAAVRVNAILVPSGDHDGVVSAPTTPAVRRLASVPAGATLQMVPGPTMPPARATRVKARLAPSGDHLGAPSGPGSVLTSVWAPPAPLLTKNSP